MIEKTYFRFSQNEGNLTINVAGTRNDPKMSALQAMQLLFETSENKIVADQSIRFVASTIFKQYNDKYDARCFICKWLDYALEVCGINTEHKTMELLHSRIMNTYNSALELDQIDTAEKPVYTAQICIKSECETGYIGDSPGFYNRSPVVSDGGVSIQDFLIDPRKDNPEVINNLLPEYLRDITFEDREPLPLDPEDFFLTIEVFNSFGKLQDNQRFPQTLHLPASIFEHYQDEDVIRLKYKGQLIELEIQQEQHGLKFAKKPFQDAYNDTKVFCESTSDLERPLFSRQVDPYWFYKLEGKNSQGTIYKFEVQELDEGEFGKRLTPVVADIQQLRPLITPKKTYQDTAIVNHTLNWNLDFPRFQIDDIEVIVTDRYIMIYGKFDEREMETGITFDNHSITIPIEGREILASLRWDRIDGLKGLTVDEMKKKITEDSVILFEDNVLKLFIPLNA